MVIKGLKKLCNAAIVNVFCFCFMMQKIIDIQSGALLCKNSGELCETDNCECSPPDRKSGVLSEFLESRTLNPFIWFWASGSLGNFQGMCL